jgi:hypothetical protein
MSESESNPSPTFRRELASQIDVHYCGLCRLVSDPSKSGIAQRFMAGTACPGSPFTRREIAKQLPISMATGNMRAWL